ncbi:MFS transporter [Streptomyces sp. NPDC058279]|uniref:MFS transporter n=1 Tax=Streptomyces sp. NPDC058279 TaxID=3346418 RepID=UPI0036EE59C5
MQSSTNSPADAPRSAARWALVCVLAANMLVDALEVSATLVALPAVGSDLALSEPRLQWVVSGFAAGFGGLLLLGGRLVERLGRRPVYLAALLVFAGASLAGALADGPGLLIATRVVKGFCVALTAPTGLAIIVSAVPEGAARRRAVSLYSFFGAAGFCAGLLLSGLLTEVGWRWTFAFPAPVALLLLAAGLRLVPRDVPAVRTRAVHTRRAAAGGAALTGTVLLLVYAVSEAAGPGRQPGRASAAFAGALLLGAGFVRAERTAGRPLVPPGLLRHAPLVRSAVGAAALNGSYVAFLFVVTLQLQRAGWTPWETALAFLPAGAPLALLALRSGRIAVRLGPARAVAAGAAAAPLGYALYPRGPATEVAYTDLLPATGCVGAAFVLAFTALHLQATAGVPAHRQAEAGAFYQTCVQLGAALTTVLVSALYTAGTDHALWLVTAVGLAGAVVALTGLGRASEPRRPSVRRAREGLPRSSRTPTSERKSHVQRASATGRHHQQRPRGPLRPGARPMDRRAGP